MRELERDLPEHWRRRASGRPPGARRRGRGPVGSSIAAAAERSGTRGGARRARRRGRGRAAGGRRAALRPRPGDRRGRGDDRRRRCHHGFAGHTSGASTLDALAPLAEAGAATFSTHPLQTVPDASTDFTACPCAIAGSEPEALALAHALGERLGMRPFEVAEDRPCGLPRGGVDRLELPRRPRGVGGRAARAGRGGGRPRAAGADRPAHRAQLGRARRRGAHRPDRAR